MFFKSVCLLSFLSMSVVALAQTQVLTADPIHVDGFLTEQGPQEDHEMKTIKNEIVRQKNETVLNKKKAQSYQELTKSVEKLSETTEEYLEEKKAAQEEIAQYNLKVKCLQAENPGSECDKFVRRRN